MGGRAPRGPHVRGKLFSRPFHAPHRGLPSWGASQFREQQDHRVTPFGHGELKANRGKRPRWGRVLPLASRSRARGLEILTGVGGALPGLSFPLVVESWL